MKISELINELRLAMSIYSDLSIFSWDGKIRNVEIAPSYNGCVVDELKPTELTLEITNE